MSANLSLLPLLLPLAVITRWRLDGWQPSGLPVWPLDFASLAIAGIPLEELGLEGDRS